MLKSREFYEKHSQIIKYFAFGLITTVLNLVSFYIFELVLGGGENTYLISNILAWVVAVASAFITNKIWVFESKSWALRQVGPELLEFIGARVFSLIFEEVGLWVLVDALRFNAFSHTVVGFEITGELIAKLLIATAVVIMNYFFSKFLIFKKR